VSRRLKLLLSAALVLASWGTSALSFATDGNVNLDDALFLLFLWIAAFASVSAAVVVVRAWQGGVGLSAVVPASLIATASTLWLALLIALGNH
jgi:hypothetical protein